MMTNLLRKSVIAALVLLGLVLTVVCDEDKSPTSASSAPARLKYVSGNNQIGQLNKILKQPLVVQILDHASDPVAAHRVIFEVTSASGVLAGNSQKIQEVQTNSNGMTSAYLVLGDSVEMEYTVQASAFDNAGNHLNDSPYLFTASVDTSGIVIEPDPGDGDGDDPEDLNESSLQLFIMSSGKWVRLSDIVDSTGVNTTNVELFGVSYEGYLWANVSGLSLFGIAGEPDEELRDAIPWMLIALAVIAIVFLIAAAVAVRRRKPREPKDKPGTGDKR